MELQTNGVSRRDFLNSAVAGAAILAVAPMFSLAATGETKSKALDIYVCGVCGHVEFGGAPDKCPVCHSPREKFSLNNSIFSDAMAKLPEGAGKHAPVVAVSAKSALVSEEPCREVSVRVGKIIHPMEEAHHIAFIDCYVDDKFVGRSPLTLQLYPAATFFVKSPGAKIRVIEWCTLHGYWQTEV